MGQLLRYVALPLLAPVYCEPYEFWLCAGSEEYIGKGTCSGDSGGPLVVPRSNSDDTAVVIGISSLGDENDENGNCGQLSIFSKVTAELKWIKANMG